ncbi:MAG: transposase [Candidatus Atribacteria bacterium]|nr:transposase [Candidatus Atribacteria bacterium]
MHEREETFRVGNEDAGIANLVKRIKELEPTLIVLEPTGGFEMLVVAELTYAGLPVVVVNAKRVRDFARATGQLTKTDKLDAKVLARRDNLAVLVALHDLNLAARYADRVALLVDGEIKATGTPRQVLTPELISTAYHLPVQVIPHPFADVPLVIPGNTASCKKL